MAVPCLKTLEMLMKSGKEIFIYFWLVNKKLYWKKKIVVQQKQQPWYTGSVQRETKCHTKLHKSRKSSKEDMGRPLKEVIHSNKDKMKMYFNSVIDHSPSKVRLFRSLHIVHIIQCGISPQIEAVVWRQIPPYQQASNSPTRLGITQDTPKKLNTNDHKL